MDLSRLAAVSVGRLVLTGAVVISAGCSHDQSNAGRPVPQNEARLIDLFSSRISLYQRFVHDMAASQYLAHRSRNYDCVLTVHAGYDATIEDGRIPGGTVILGLPSGDKVTEAAAEFCVKYNLYRIRDADEAFIAGRKEIALGLLTLIAEKCHPLADDCSRRIAAIKSGLSESDYSTAYVDTRTVFPALSQALADRLAENKSAQVHSPHGSRSDEPRTDSMTND